jgi:hypothetical protein
MSYWHQAYPYNDGNYIWPHKINWVLFPLTYSLKELYELTLPQIFERTHTCIKYSGLSVLTIDPIFISCSIIQISYLF